MGGHPCKQGEGKRILNHMAGDHLAQFGPGHKPHFANVLPSDRLGSPDDSHWMSGKQINVLIGKSLRAKKNQPKV